MLKKELLDILCCPRCKGNLNYDSKDSTLTCASCGAVYQVKNDIPIMLMDEGQNS